MDLLITLNLLLLPLVVLPFGVSQFETPKVVVFEILNIFTLFSLVVGKYKPVIDRKLVVFLSSILILAVTNYLLNPLDLSLSGNPFRLQGIFLLLNLLFIAFVSSQIELKLNKFLLWGTFVVLFVFGFIIGTDENSRIIGTLGEANSMAGYFVYLWPLVLSALPKNMKHTKSLVLLFLAMTLVIVFFSGSRSGLIAILTQIIFLVSYYKFKARLPLAMLLSIIFLVASLVLPFLDIAGKYQVRTRIWETAINSGLQKPLLGFGFGNTEIALKEAAYRLENSLRFEYVDSTHNVFLDWFVQGGIVGLALISGLILYTFKNYIRKKEVFYVASFLGVIGVMLFNPVSVCILIAFWWLVGESFYTKLSHL